MTGIDTCWFASPAAGLVAAGLGCGLGLSLARAVDGWFHATDERGVSRRTTILAVTVATAAAVGLWWWEVHGVGTNALAVRGDTVATACGERWSRFLAHAALFWLLAAATWIDFRQRVIPDWITTPGVLLGLLAAWTWPRSLLTTTVETPRAFAVPAVQNDVLAWYGGLHVGVGSPLGPAPHVAGLGVAAAIFLAWWVVCTEPGGDVGGTGRWSIRNALLALGLSGIIAAWLIGTPRFAALETALVGAAVSGGLVWAIRAGASAALGREAMGLGDVTLMAMAGAWLGWQACVIAFFLAAFIGVGHGIAQLLLHRENELPFGPSLCLATACVVLTWRTLWPAIAVYFEQPGLLAIVVGCVVVLTAVALLAWRRLRRGG